MGKTCFLCKSSVDDELLFGRFYSKWKLTVHYYCLLLSSNLVQRGSNDTVGIFGFLESDIRKENERTKKCRCYICKNMHANVSCCSKKCLRTFHTVCGITNGCLSHYTDTYQSWCAEHVPLEPDTDPHSPEDACSICYDEMGQYDLITSIKAPCCRNGWFHQRCLAQYAESAGYFFKCPLCKNEEKFVAEVPLRGVFVPERDAAWELEPNAFQEQLLRPTVCDAEDCKCQAGRTLDDRQWPLVICGSCGSTCRHRQCMDQTAEGGSQIYLCQLCRPIVGEHVSMLIGDTSDDSSDDDTSSTSTSVSLPGTFRNKRMSKVSGSGESGVHCSSSDEPLINIRRKGHSSARRISDDSEDSDRSDGSSIQIRRFVRQNTGKRVRRLLSDGSDEGKRTAATYDSTDTLPTHIQSGSPARPETDNVSSDSSERIELHARITRQLTRRLSSLSDSSKRSTSVSTNSSERLECSSKCRPRIASSADESEEKQPEGEKKASDGEEGLSTTGQQCTKSTSSSASPSTSSAARRLSYCSSKDSNKRSDDTEDYQQLGKKRVRKSFQLRIRPLNDKRSNAGEGSVPSESASEWDENFDPPPKQDKVEKANQSESRRPRHPSSSTAPTERSTSESSIELKPNKPKRTRISARTVSSEKRTEEAAAAGAELDCVPQNKRRRLTRERRNNQHEVVKQLQEPPPISPPSTPSSLSSEASQQSVTSDRRESAPKKNLTHCSRTPETQQKREQQSMLQFITVSSAEKEEAVVASENNLSQDEVESVSPFGKGNKGSSKNGSNSRKRTEAVVPPKRRRTHAPKKKSSSSPATTQSAGKKQSPPAPTSNKATVQHRATVVHHKDKGQKNILNYFNRC
ncbi:dentin sialophosphoprotein-like [Anopheles maculipalpis]|uniref:dentin sialophosphoprotein-like n=1 Tax=Anopheles maculipalpis TaxID=1496333 RepID=UPI0021593A03|nr:dentin sialophosphoprotein-like [Anopheles maculipalpis]